MKACTQRMLLACKNFLAIAASYGGNSGLVAQHAQRAAQDVYTCES